MVAVFCLSSLARQVGSAPSLLSRSLQQPVGAMNPLVQAGVIAATRWDKQHLERATGCQDCSGSRWIAESRHQN